MRVGARVFITDSRTRSHSASFEKSRDDRARGKAVAIIRNCRLRSISILAIEMTKREHIHVIMLKLRIMVLVARCE